MKVKDIQLKYYNDSQKNIKIYYNNEESSISPGVFYINNGKIQRNYKNSFALFDNDSKVLRHTFVKQNKYNFNIWKENSNYFSYGGISSSNVDILKMLKVID